VRLGDRGSRLRCLLVWASMTSALATVVIAVLPHAERLLSDRSALEALPVDVVLVDVAAAVVLGCAAWAWLALSATVAEAWRGVPAELRRPWHLPPCVRRVVLLSCGVALASTVVAPCGAVAGGSPRHRGASVLTGLPLPDRAVAPPHPSHHIGRTVVVRPGDTLWSIAARDLPPEAVDTAIVTRWHAIYAANRGVIGPDPDLIEPGQHLELPRKDRL